MSGLTHSELFAILFGAAILALALFAMWKGAVCLLAGILTQADPEFEDDTRVRALNRYQR